jgi:hypothetical protein
MSLHRTLRWLLILAAICAVVWLGTIIYWQETRRAVDEGDVARFIIGLPLALFGATLTLWLGAQALLRRTRTGITPAVQAPSTNAMASDAEAPSHFRIAILSATAATPSGDAAAVLAALQNPDKLTAPAASVFYDDEGFRIPLFRLNSLDTADVAQWHQHWHENTDPSPDGSPNAPSERLLRSLSLLIAPLDEARELLTDVLQPTPVTTPPPTLVRPSAHAPPVAAPSPPRVQALVLIPSETPEPALRALRAFVESRLQTWLPGNPAHVTLSAPTARNGADIISTLHQMLANDNGRRGRNVVLLIGTDSLVDESIVNRLMSDGQLATARRPEGITPGEGAFVVAFAAESLAPSLAAAYLHQPARVQRMQPADVGSKVVADALQQALQNACSNAQQNASACAALIVDGNGRGRRAVEAAQAMTFALDHLDPVADRLDSGALLGELGAAQFPALLTIAATFATAQQQTCAVAALSPAIDRDVFIIAPALPQATATATA